jgi:hypothetical protein
MDVNIGRVDGDQMLASYWPPTEEILMSAVRVMSRYSQKISVRTAIEDKGKGGLVCKE